MDGMGLFVSPVVFIGEKKTEGEQTYTSENGSGLSTPKSWRFGSNDVPFQLGDFVGSSPLIFRGSRGQ